ncbi:hypothetical protein [Pseudomonas lurida]|uniref:hypothetical protein n=1 Tax=Pseudomonas lurida TaxID=244566 RepID=UPI00177F45EE|nr:hypothetical protein [Pseudomonas lurida]MBD8671590.1 hypothetical protein [Pseudomonas lurida]
MHESSTTAPLAPAQIEYAYARSVGADIWIDDSLAAYLSDGETSVGAVIARGVIERPSASRFVPDAGEMIEAMGEQAQCSDYSEWADDFPSVSDEALAELEALLEPIRAWADRRCPVSFFTVSGAEPYTVTADDIAAAEQYRLEETERAAAAGL